MNSCLAAFLEKRHKHRLDILAKAGRAYHQATLGADIRMKGDNIHTGLNPELDEVQLMFCQDVNQPLQLGRLESKVEHQVFETA